MFISAPLFFASTLTIMTIAKEMKMMMMAMMNVLVTAVKTNSSPDASLGGIQGSNNCHQEQ